MSTERLVADVVVERLRAWGVPRVFGYSGDGINALMAALRRAGGKPEFVQARHEENAAFMAVGHAKHTGGAGVVEATQGPGAVHLLNGLYDAKLDGVPVVAIMGQQETTVLGSQYQQEVDLHTLVKDVAAQFSQTATSAEQVPMLLDRAFRTALATRSPSVLVLPHDVQQLPAPDESEHEHAVVVTAPAWRPPRVLPHDDDLRAAADVLNAGERVALLVGQGVRGVCDTLLMVGTNDPWTEFYPAPGQARAVQVDLDGRHFGNRYPVEVGLTGDAAETLQALLPLRDERTDRRWREDVEAHVREWRDVAATRAATPARPLNPELVVRELASRLPSDAQVSVDVGSIVYWYARQLRLPPGVPAHLSSTLASMGSALPYGLAAKLAHPDRPLVALAGDGAMQMNGVNELITVSHRWRSWADPRFVVLVLHNGDLAEVTWEQRETEGDPRFVDSQQLPDFPYAAYAELLGLRGIRVDDPADVPDVWDRALSADRPTLIEAIVDPDVPLLPPFPAGRSKLDSMRAGLAQEGSAGEHARELLR